MRKKFHSVIFLTTRCNLACSHCIVDKSNLQDIPIKTLERIVEYGPSKTNLMGGEVFLYPHLKEAFDILSDIPITLQTNAILVPENMEYLKGIRQVICSIEGTKKNTDAVRGKDVYDKVMNSVKLLKDNNIPVMLRASLWEGNLLDVPKLVKLSKSLGVELYFYPRLDRPPLNAGQQIWLFKQLEQSETCWLDLPEYFCAALKSEGFCAAGESRLAFTVNGEIHPCQFYNHLLGYVGDDWGSIERNADAFVELKRIPPECLGCEWSGVCSGGCMLTPWYSGCPNRPSIKRYIEFGEEFGHHKTEVVKRILSGVVTC